MATQKQIDANRRNARKSTGPRTPEGKAASRMNALKHGLRANTLVLDCKLHHESPVGLQALFDALTDELAPGNRIEKSLIRELAVTRWKIERAERMELMFTDQTPRFNTEAAQTLAAVHRVRERLERRLRRTLSLYQHLRWFSVVEPLGSGTLADKLSDLAQIEEVSFTSDAPDAPPGNVPPAE